MPVHRTGVHRTGTEEPLKGALIGICALGGGTIENSAAMEHFSIYGYFCYIREERDLLYRRIISRGMPAFLNPTDPESDFSMLYAHRTRRFEELADVTIDGMGRNREDLYRALKKKLKETVYGRK